MSTEHFPRAFELPNNNSDSNTSQAAPVNAFWNQYETLASGSRALRQGTPTKLLADAGSAQSNGTDNQRQPSSNEPSLLQLETAFEQEHKVKISSANGKFVYSMQYEGSVHNLFETNADKAGLDSASANLKSLVSDEESSLTSTFHVSFAKQGEVVTDQKETADSKPLPHQVTARDPELFELEGIKAALEKSAPSNIASDGKTGVKYYCLTEKPILGIDSFATFQNDKDSKPSVYLWPKFNEINIATEKDRTSAQNLPFSDGDRPESVEGAMIHELGHHQFMKLGFDPKNSKNETASVTAQTQLFEKMGWLPRLDEKDADYNWLLVGKSKDDNGQPATYLPSFTGMFFSFGRWQQKGGPVDEHGKRVPADKMQQLGEDQMVAEAKIKPPTWYFENPEEEYAEAVRMYRMNDESRRSLMQGSPALYSLMKENDQRELDQMYGTNADGSSKKVRSNDFKIVEGK